MASSTSAELASNKKTSVLRVSIHCEGCKRKVKKILQSLPGVDEVEIETKLQRVVVTGDVLPDTLLNRLLKAGKHAQLWPQEPRNSNPPENNNHQKIEKPPANQESITQQPAVTGKQVPPQDSFKPTGAGAPVDEGVGKVAAEAKLEEKKPETGSAGNQGAQPAVEKKEDQTEKNAGGGEAKKKKKKKGQNGNEKDIGESSAAPPPPATNVSSNQSPPRHQGYEYPPPHYYAPPPAPAYAVSYNTAHPPLNSYTASYYAAPSPYSYAYARAGADVEPPAPQPYQPLDFDSYTQRPLDSFEMFSDENPNGCLVM